jgi:DNA polymerase-3 subunit gamma/tau
MLSQAAFNALLKTLEEPPPHVKFVFATTESHKVLPTIVSRCQRFEFRSIPVDLISLKLKEICAKENIEVEPPALEAIARMAMGGMRDAQSILDQMISFCGNSITQQNVLEVYGLVSADRIDSLARAILSADYGSILNETDAFSQEGLDFYRALQDLSDHFRQKLVLELSDAGNDSYPEQIVRILDALREGDELVRLGLSEKTNFEVTLFRAVESGKSRSIDQVIRKISKVLPEKELKKKTEHAGITDHDLKDGAVDTKTISTPLESNLLDVIEKPPLDTLSSVDPNPEEIVETAEIEKKETKDKSTEPKDERQIQDESEISKRVEQLPEKLRKSLVEDYKVNFVSIEKIDSSQLI